MKFRIVVAHTLCPRLVDILAEHIVEVDVSSGQEVLGRMIHKVLLNKQTIKD